MPDKIINHVVVDGQPGKFYAPNVLTGLEETDEITKLKSGIDDLTVKKKLTISIKSSTFIYPNTMKWAIQSGMRSKIVPINPNTYYRIVRNQGTDAIRYACLTGYDSTNGNTPEWATGYTELAILPAGKSDVTFKAPSDARFIVYNTTNLLDTSICDIYECEANTRISDIESKINYLYDSDDTKDVVMSKGYWSDNNGVAVFASDSGWRSGVIDISDLAENAVIQIASGSFLSYSNLVHSLNVADDSGNIIYFEGTNGTVKSFEIKKSQLPTNASYIYVNGNSSADNLTVIGLLYRKPEKLEQVYTLLKSGTTEVPIGVTNTGRLTIIPIGWPYFIKGFKYRLAIKFAETITISGATIYLKYGNDSVDNGYTEQVITIVSGSTTAKEIVYDVIPARDASRIELVLTLPSALGSAVGIESYIYEEDVTPSDIDEVSDNILSDTSAFLMSYTNGGASGKLDLAISTDGMTFHKITDSYIFDPNIAEGFQHDIDIIEKDGYFYITATSDVVENDNVVLTVYRSKNLSDWQLYGTINIPLSSFSFETGNSFLSLWAPEILLLNGAYCLSFAVCEATSPYVIKGYICDLSNDFLTCSNIRQLTINTDWSKYTFDTSIYYDADNGKYYAMYWDCGIYEADSLDGEWKPVGFLPAEPNGYRYMEAPTIIKEGEWYFIYGDGTTTQNVANNLLCWKTKNFKHFEMADTQFDTRIRHPKVIQINVLAQALATKIHTDSVGN